MGIQVWLIVMVCLVLTVYLASIFLIARAVQSESQKLVNMYDENLRLLDAFGSHAKEANKSTTDRNEEL